MSGITNEMRSRKFILDYQVILTRISTEFNKISELKHKLL